MSKVVDRSPVAQDSVVKDAFTTATECKNAEMSLHDRTPIIAVSYLKKMP